MSGAYANAVEDVAPRMARPFSSDQETARADVLCEDASNMVRERFADVDDRIAAGTLMLATVKRIVAQAVVRAVQNATADGLSSQQQGAGPFSTNVVFANAGAALYFNKADVAALSGESAGKGKAFSVDLSPAASFAPSSWD